MAKLIFLATICLTLHCSLAFRLRIAQGTDIDIEKVPYLATLVYYGEDEESNGEPFCGASIISDQWLLTAAHCLLEYPKEELKVRTGATLRYNDGEEHEIEQTITHPDFKQNHYTHSDDLGLIKLTKPIKFNNKQKPVSLPSASDEPKVGDVVIVAGFGREEPYTEEKTLHLKVAFMPVVDLEKCKDDYYFDPVDEKHLCAGNGSSSCKGDSGGPGVIEGKLHGIVSSGYICDTSNVPAVFMSVNKYLDWISSSME